VSLLVNHTPLRHARGVADTTDLGTATESASALDATVSASSSPAPPSRDITPGTLIGRYVVLAKLGAGGMGIVFAAYDPELDRKIALKLLKAQGQSSARTRLQREAQALAKLDHRNVVSVHDVGVHDGQLFVAMEFVAGKTLGAWMAELEHPRPWPEVLRVFAEAGRGLAAAHESGLVHRDFKPDNVMLGDDGRVRVMDFGLARAEGEEAEVVKSSLEVTGKQLLVTPLTQTGAMLGTPAYMSPEQFEGKGADPRSDQFGFCVSLYEALYGARPFAGKTVPQLVLAVTQGQVEPAPKGVAVPTWLRTIVVRGLAPKPDERWPSMRALLDALADDPAVRRRKWFAVATVVGLLGGVTWGLSWAVREDAQTCAGFDERLAGVWDDDRRAKVSAAIEATKLSYAPGTWQRVEQRLDEYTQQWLAARVQACEATHNGEQSAELLDLRMACLDERLQHVRATVDVLARADETVVKKAVEAVANLPTLERCADVDALTASIPPPEDPEVAKRVAALDEQLVQAEALEKTGKYAEGLLLVDAVATEGASLQYEPLLVRAWFRQGGLQNFTGNYELAEATLERAYESAVGQNMLIEAAKVSRLLVSVVGYRLARHQDGRRWAKDAKPLARAAGMDDVLADYLNNLGLVVHSEGKYEEARSYLEQALAIRERVLGPDHPSVAASLINLGNVAVEEAKYDDARGYYERALAIHEQALGPEHPHVAVSLNNLGGVAAKHGKLEEARAYFEQALAIYEKALGLEHPHVAASLNNLGNVAWTQGKHEDARGYHERALAIREKVLGPEHPDVAESFNNLGVVALALGKHEDARSYHERALALREKVLGPEHPDVAVSIANVGEVAYSEGKYEEARAYLERALAIEQKVLTPEHPRLAHTWTRLGETLLGQGKPAEALPLLERALIIRTAKPGESTEVARLHFALARALWDAPAQAGRDRERARTFAEQARSAYAAVGETFADELEQVEAWQGEHGQ
jgi:Tfp pilus assembly protein PilF/predicted Ser/Thr protein kinase